MDEGVRRVAKTPESSQQRMARRTAKGWESHSELAMGKAMGNAWGSHWAQEWVTPSVQGSVTESAMTTDARKGA